MTVVFPEKEMPLGLMATLLPLGETDTRNAAISEELV
jgi:hypothetical protein